MSGYDLRVIGDVVVVPCSNVKSASCTTLIMGATGSGKSTFIEALAGDARFSLDISSDQLSGFTQEVNAYQLKNAGYIAGSNDNDPWPVYLIDTPGFSDTKISEMAIVRKIKKWMSDQGIDIVSLIFYLCPITDTRVPGRKRRTINMVQSLLQTNSARHITVVTTMWDTVSNPQAERRAEMHYSQLRDDIWKEVIDNGASIARFQNNFESAFDIVRTAIVNAGGRVPLNNTEITANHPSAPFLYRELLERIDSTRQHKKTFQLEKNELIIRPNQELEFIVTPKLQEAEHDLAKFLGELVVFGTPPQGFEAVPEQAVYQDLIDCVKASKEHSRAIKVALRHSDDPIRRSSLKEELKRVNVDLARSAVEILKFGSPPTGYKQIVLPYHVLTLKESARQAMREAMRLLKTKR